jgi:alcohol dehydrogenase class IV
MGEGEYKMINFYMPTNVQIGVGAASSLADYASFKNEQVLLVSSEDVSQHMGGISTILDSLGVSQTKLLMEAGEPTCDFIDSSAANLKKLDFDYVIGFGGGSAIDMAKSLAIALKNPEPIWNYANLSNRPPSPMIERPIPVIAIPTTAGTGSEVTPYAVLSKTDTKQKGTIQDPSIFPKLAIIDPTFHMTLPAKLTASTGIDAFTHAFEAYINISKDAPAAEWAAREAIGLIFHNLETAYKEPNNVTARTNMAWACTLAGIAISHRGTSTPHAIAEPMGALLKIPHGLAVSLCTLPVLRASTHVLEDKLVDLLRFINKPEMDQTTFSAAMFVTELEQLMLKLEIPKSVKEIMSLPENSVDLVLENVLKFKFRPLKQHPIEFEENELLKIINEIINGK